MNLINLFRLVLKSIRSHWKSFSSDSCRSCWRFGRIELHVVWCAAISSKLNLGNLYLMTEIEIDIEIFNLKTMPCSVDAKHSDTHAHRIVANSQRKQQLIFASDIQTIQIHTSTERNGSREKINKSQFTLFSTQFHAPLIRPTCIVHSHTVSAPASTFFPVQHQIRIHIISYTYISLHWATNRFESRKRKTRD